MARRKKIVPGKIISVRVTDEDLEMLREAARLQETNASAILREALRTLITVTC